MPTVEMPTAAPLEVSALSLAPKVEGTIVDQYGAAMAGVILCVGASEAEAAPLGQTDASGF